MGRFEGKSNKTKPVLNSLEINTQHLHVKQFERKRKKTLQQCHNRRNVYLKKSHDIHYKIK